MSETPDIIGTVRGYRYWQLQNGKLASVAWPYVWKDGLNTAGKFCYGRPCGHLPPSRRSIQLDGCECGFYSKYRPFAVPRGWPTGVVENEGVILLHKDGLRSERARIVAVHHRDLLTREMLRTNYPGTQVYASRRKMRHDFPQTARREICGVPLPKRIPRKPIVIFLVTWLTLMVIMYTVEGLIGML